MDAEQAERWRQDSRVAGVEQERTLSTNENEVSVTPAYRNNRLGVPVVDSADQPVLFQDSEFASTRQSMPGAGFSFEPRRLFRDLSILSN